MTRSSGLLFKLFGPLSPLTNTYLHWELSEDVHILFWFLEFLNPQEIPRIGIGEISPKREIKNTKFENEIISEVSHNQKKEKKKSK